MEKHIFLPDAFCYMLAGLLRSNSKLYHNLGAVSTLFYNVESKELKIATTIATKLHGESNLFMSQIALKEVLLSCIFFL